MKTKFLLVFLLAIGGSTSAQLVLTIGPPNFLPGVTQAPVDQNGWRNFKLILNQNVTSFSFVGVPPPSQAAANVIFTQDAIGGRSVTFASNITNPCTISSAANATTLCQFEFDGVAGIWIGISGSGAAPVTAVSGTNVTTQGVSTSNTAAQNQTAFAAIAAGVNAGTLAPYIYIPAGTYNVLSTGSSALGTYGAQATSFGVVIHCENPATTIINHTGTGKLIQFGQSGQTFGGSIYPWVQSRFENCQVTGGASASDGIYNAPEYWGLEIKDNFFFNYGSASMNAIHGDTDGWIRVHHNYYLRTDGVLGNFAYAQVFATTPTYLLLEASDNKVICAISNTNNNSQVCGSGFASDFLMEAKRNVISGPSPCFRCRSTSVNLGTCTVNDNLIEVFGTNGVMFGTVGGSAESITNVNIENNQVYLAASTQFVGPANANSKLINATITGNHRRADSVDTLPMVGLNNLTGQTGNIQNGNTGWALNNFLTTGTNIAVAPNQYDSVFGTASSGVGSQIRIMAQGDTIARSSITNSNADMTHAAGAHQDSTGWVADFQNETAFNESAGNGWIGYGDTLLTVGNHFTPTQRWSITQLGIATFPAYASNTNCAVNSASPAACGAAPAGAVVIPTTTTSYTINTSAVTAASRIFLQPMTWASNLPSTPTCVAPAAGFLGVSASTAATSFTVTLPSTTGTVCLNYWIVN